MRKLKALLETLGVAGVFGLGALLFCIPFYLTAVNPLERELDAWRVAEQRLKSRAPYQKTSGDNSAEELRRFQNLFPPIEGLTGEMERLYSLARNANLELQQGEYRLDTRGSGLTAYRVTLPVSGAYPQIREFIGAVLKEMPIASVDSLRFERKKITDTRLEAQIRLILYFRPQSEAGLP